MATVLDFLTRRRGRDRFDLMDWLTWIYLILGILLMFGPVVWVALSSFKTDRGLADYPPTFLPLAAKTVTVAGYDEPLPLYKITGGEYAGRELAQIRRIGLIAQMVDPAHPDERLKVNINDRVPERSLCSRPATTPSCSRSSISPATCGTRCS